MPLRGTTLRADKGKQINDIENLSTCVIILGGGTLPTQCNPTSSAKKKQAPAPKKPPKYLTPK
jgi:hypothetical protein